MGIAVHHAAGAAETFSRLAGNAASEMEEVGEQAVRVCFVPSGGSGRLELLEPVRAETAAGRFQARRGEGLHHVCFLVDDVVAELARLEQQGFQPVDRTPRRGQGGLVAFLHPRTSHGVLVELLQRDP